MGNEAIALGAIEAGVQVVTGYPGTPSTEALETIARYANRCGIYTEWSSNEKVALETAAGAAYSGAKALVTMEFGIISRLLSQVMITVCLRLRSVTFPYSFIILSRSPTLKG